MVEHEIRFVWVEQRKIKVQRVLRNIIMVDVCLNPIGALERLRFMKEESGADLLYQVITFPPSSFVNFGIYNIHGLALKRLVGLPNVKLRPPNVIRAN